MSDFHLVRGFEEVWRPAARPPIKFPERGRSAAPDPRARLRRIAARVPEVMVKVTGRTRDAGQLAAHLTYITRNGQAPAEDREGWAVSGRREVEDLARDWAALQAGDPRRRANSPYSVALMLSMPAGTDAIGLRDAARSFAREAFGARFDYVLALHTDTPHPHVHLTVRALGDDGSRLNPKKADLEAWRQAFAQALRDRGIAAEATPRRARGVTRKAERTGLRKIRERAEAGRGAVARTQRGAYREAARTAFGEGGDPAPWDLAIVARQRRVRALYAAQAAILRASGRDEDKVLGEALAAFVAAMPAAETQRRAMERALRRARPVARQGHEAKGREQPPPRR